MMHWTSLYLPPSNTSHGTYPDPRPLPATDNDYPLTVVITGDMGPTPTPWVLTPTYSWEAGILEYWNACLLVEL